MVVIIVFGVILILWSIIISLIILKKDSAGKAILYFLLFAILSVVGCIITPPLGLGVWLLLNIIYTKLLKKN